MYSDNAVFVKIYKYDVHFNTTIIVILQLMNAAHHLKQIWFPLRSVRIILLHNSVSSTTEPLRPAITQPERDNHTCLCLWCCSSYCPAEVAPVFLIHLST